jgi:hypothetical protein
MPTFGQALGGGNPIQLTMADLEPSRLSGNIASRIRKLVLLLMAGLTKRDQIVQSIVAELTSFRQMVYVQVFRRTTILTPPAISFEHSAAK